MHICVYICTECDLPITFCFVEILDNVIKVYPHGCLQAYVSHVYVFSKCTICEIMTLVLTV